MAASDTRERLLDVAEQLFAERGISGTSLRELTGAADVNLAAVHYHFGSKEGLLDAVVERRASPINRERVAALDAFEARDTPPSVEELLWAMCAPGVRELREGPESGQLLQRLIARIDAQPPEVVESLYRKHFGEVGRRFIQALQAALPALPKETVAERYRLCIGCLTWVFSGNFALDVIPGHPSGLVDDESKMRHSIAFLSGGLRAPDPKMRALDPPTPERCEA
ncbi:MAG: TetR/AcrR family transcriptional regulator [Myxococcota bacterium]